MLALLWHKYEAEQKEPVVFFMQSIDLLEKRGTKYGYVQAKGFASVNTHVWPSQVYAAGDKAGASDRTE